MGTAIVVQLVIYVCFAEVVKVVIIVMLVAIVVIMNVMGVMIIAMNVMVIAMNVIVIAIFVTMNVFQIIKQNLCIVYRFQLDSFHYYQ